VSNLLTVKEVAEKFGIKEHQVRYAIRTGKLKGVTKKGWMLLIKSKSLPKKWPVKGAD
jgi:predicted DNA-binding transcriptional regulator